MSRCKSYLFKLFKNARQCFSTKPEWKYQFLNGASAQYIEDLYTLWRKDPSLVDASWNTFFKTEVYTAPVVHDIIAERLQKDIDEKVIQTDLKVPEVQLRKKKIDKHPQSPNETRIVKTKRVKTRIKVLSVENGKTHLEELIRVFQTQGHFLANVNSLDTQNNDFSSSVHNSLHQWLLKLQPTLGQSIKVPRSTFVGGSATTLPIRDIINRLQTAYTGSIGVEINHVHNFDHSNWIKMCMECPGEKVTKFEKIQTWKWLTKASIFKIFISKKWPNEEVHPACESAIPLLNQIIQYSSNLGLNRVVIGGTEQERFTILATVCEKPMYEIFTLFNETLKTDPKIAGDFKQNLGSEVDLTLNGKKVKISLTANPFHLEQVTPVTLGKCYGNLTLSGGESQSILPILIHDAVAFAEKGVAYETIQLSNLARYNPEGVIHIILSNRLKSNGVNLCRIINAPILHVNGDDSVAIVQVAKMAAEFRAKFHKDIVVVIVDPRRSNNLKNEEQKLTSVLEKYSSEIKSEKLLQQSDMDAYSKKFECLCQHQYRRSLDQDIIKLCKWNHTPFKAEPVSSLEPETGISESIISHIGQVFAQPPKNLDLTLHNQVKRIWKVRSDMLARREIDWAIGEALAFGSLLKDGIHVRLSGEDVERGTFSHRHHTIHDLKKDQVRFDPLNNLYPEQALYTVSNSLLSENGVLGFEYGYSLAEQPTLTLWEAQFGDFMNTAQSTIDEYIAAGAIKWGQKSGLVLLLPHGMEGQGAEHSNCHQERFFQLSIEPVRPAENPIAQLRHTNWILVNCSTAAQYMHALRRQLFLPFRKPLVIFTPKFLLRYPPSRSSFTEILPGTKFRRLIPELGAASQKPQGVEKLMFCNGKVYYEICEQRAEKELENKIAVCRVEQLVPFPWDLVKTELEKYRKAKVCWVQEEHRNKGAWYFMEERFWELGVKNLTYIGRGSSSASATGHKHTYKTELEEIRKKIVEM